MAPEHLTFGGWIQTERRRVVPAVLFLLLAVLTIIATAQRWFAIPETWRESLEPLLPAASYVIHAVVALGLLFVATAHPREDEERSPEATTALRHFHRIWRALWLSWVLLYVLFLAQELYLQFGTQGVSQETSALVLRVAAICLSGAHNLSLLFVLLCYLLLARPRAPIPWTPWAGVLLVVTAFEAISRFAESQFTTVMLWASGFIAGTTLALFVGRLESHRIKTPRAIIALLYGYAAIQISWAIFEAEPTIRLTMTSAALPLKFLLFLVVHWAMQSGLMLYYIDRTMKDRALVHGERRRFVRGIGWPRSGPVVNGLAVSVMVVDISPDQVAIVARLVNHRRTTHLVIDSSRLNRLELRCNAELPDGKTTGFDLLHQQKRRVRGTLPERIDIGIGDDFTFPIDLPMRLVFPDGPSDDLWGVAGSYLELDLWIECSDGEDGTWCGIARSEVTLARLPSLGSVVD